MNPALPLLGMRLAAAVVVKEKTVDQTAFLSACEERLPKFKMPSQVEIVAKLPLNNNGKVDKAACLSICCHSGCGKRKAR